MQGDKIEIRYYSRNFGYVTETFENTAVQGAINAIRARASDATIIGVTHHPAPTHQSDARPSDQRR